MKKIFLLLVLFLFLCPFWVRAADFSLEITADKNTAIVGETVQIGITATNVPAEVKKIRLTICDPTTNTESTKREFDDSNWRPDTTITLLYDWDTSQSNLGVHRVQAYGLNGFGDQIKASEPFPYTLTAPPDLRISFSQESAKIGQTVKISSTIGSNLAAEIRKVRLIICDSATSNESIKEEYDRSMWEDGATFFYNWDTSASNAGLHRVQLYGLDNNNKKVAESQPYSFNLTVAGDENGASPSPTPGAGFSGGFDLGKLGKIVFPSTKVGSAKALIVVIINWLLSIVGIFALVAIVYSGVMYITAGGDAAKAEAARKNLTWAIIGIIIVVLCLVIVSFVKSQIQ